MYWLLCAGWRAVVGWRRDGERASTAWLEETGERYGQGVGLERLLISRSVLRGRAVVVVVGGGEVRKRQENHVERSARTHRGQEGNGERAARTSSIGSEMQCAKRNI
jgi:hypothetical protein